MSKLLRDDWRDRKATSTPGDVEAEEWPETVKRDDEAWLDPDFGLPPLHPSELDPLPDWNAPLRQTWIHEHIALLHAAERVERDGAYATEWRGFETLLRDVRKLDSLRRASLDPEKGQPDLEKFRAFQQLQQVEQQKLAAFVQGPSFQIALDHYITVMTPIWERIEARNDDSPEQQTIFRAHARHQRRNFESLRCAKQADDTAQSTPEPTVIADAVPAREQAAPAATKDAQEPSGTSRHEANDTREAKEYATKVRICQAFPAPKSVNAERWASGGFLGDCPGWLKTARESNGKRGVLALWNPAQFAFCMVSNGHIGKGAAAAIVRREFPDWLDAWEEKALSLDSLTGRRRR
ncbi:hypothetical protein [Aromatoleum anaerobium]|uniref:Uncharacterized protein n=1 Tax=Aromatoleum anaerobium TaxID=182180 RepID=A0ABX1PNE8_9RHOO|nr:hypothetical protein [Aromatoleum anaerobium]MCK0506320.1 hypothetical protein [Aromatoleum anaerobium]